MALDLEQLKDMPSAPLEERHRQVIREGTEVLGGVLLTRTNIVVDTDENPRHYDIVLEAVDERLKDLDDVSTLDRLMTVQAVCAEALVYDEDDYGQLLKAEAIARGG